MEGKLVEKGREGRRMEGDGEDSSTAKSFRPVRSSSPTGDRAVL